VASYSLQDALKPAALLDVMVDKPSTGVFVHDGGVRALRLEDGRRGASGLGCRQTLCVDGPGARRRQVPVRDRLVMLRAIDDRRVLALVLVNQRDRPVDLVRLERIVVERPTAARQVGEHDTVVLGGPRDGGVVALLLAKSPGLSASDALRLLRDTSIQPAGAEGMLVDACAALISLIRRGSCSPTSDAGSTVQSVHDTESHAR